MFYALELVGTEQTETTLNFSVGKTFLVGLQEFENIIDNDCLQIDLFLVIEILGFELDLEGEK